MGRRRSAVTASLGALGLAGALALGPAAPVSAGQELHPDWGHVEAKSGVLKRGCHTYTYTYSITPPAGLWAIETFIRGPAPVGGHGRVALANGAFLTGYDPETGTGHFTLCKPSTRYGKFTIRARVSVQDGASYTEGWLPTAHFRLHARHRQHG